MWAVYCDKQGGTRAVSERRKADGMIAKERHLRTARGPPEALKEER